MLFRSTGAAQHYRDSRILTIYEGTTAIQANDIVGRKTIRDGGAVAKAICAQIAATEKDLLGRGNSQMADVAKSLAEARVAFEGAIDYILESAKAKTNTKAVYAGAVPYLRLAGVVLGGWQMARALLIAEDKMSEDPDFYKAK